MLQDIDHQFSKPTTMQGGDRKNRKTETGEVRAGIVELGRIRLVRRHEDVRPRATQNAGDLLIHRGEAFL